jgi:hypothetical protein
MYEQKFSVNDFFVEANMELELPCLENDQMKHEDI